MGAHAPFGDIYFFLFITRHPKQVLNTHHVCSNFFNFLFLFWFNHLSQHNAPTFTHNDPKRHPKGPNNLFWHFVWASGMYFFFKCLLMFFLFFLFNWLPHPSAPTFTHNNTRRAQTTHFDTSFGPKVCILSYNFLCLSVAFLIFIALYILCRLALIFGSLIFVVAFL